MKVLIKITTAVGVSPTLEADYKRGQLSKITLKKGILPPDYWKAIGHILPPTESDIEAFKQQFVGKVSYQKSEGSSQKSDSLYKQFLDEWFVFYHRFAGVPPRFNVADGKQDVEVNGIKRHVLGYLQDFLFPPKRAMTPVKALSGGERNRLLLAKLLLKPNNLLILDEPTNDLDVETLELLEEILTDYQGTLLIVSHDRQFIDNTATECYIFEGDGVLNKYVGGFFDAKQQQANYFAQRAEQDAVKQKKIEPKKEESAVENKSVSNKPKPVKLSYKEQRELEQLPQLLEDLEEKITALQTEIGDPNFFQQSHDVTDAKLKALADAEAELETAFMRWEALEEKKNVAEGK